MSLLSIKFHACNLKPGHIQTSIFSTLQGAAKDPQQYLLEQQPYQPTSSANLSKPEGAEGGEAAEDAIAIEGKEEEEDLGLDGLPLKKSDGSKQKGAMNCCILPSFSFLICFLQVQRARVRSVAVDKSERGIIEKQSVI